MPNNSLKPIHMMLFITIGFLTIFLFLMDFEPDRAGMKIQKRSFFIKIHLV